MENQNNKIDGPFTVDTVPTEWQKVIGWAVVGNGPKALQALNEAIAPLQSENAALAQRVRELEVWQREVDDLLDLEEMDVHQVKALSVGHIKVLVAHRTRKLQAERDRLREAVLKANGALKEANRIISPRVNEGYAWIAQVADELAALAEGKEDCNA